MRALHLMTVAEHTTGWGSRLQGAPELFAKQVPKKSHNETELMRFGKQRDDLNIRLEGKCSNQVQHFHIKGH